MSDDKKLSDDKKYGFFDQADKIAVSGGVSLILSLQSVQKGILSFLLEFAVTWLGLFVFMYLAQIAFDSMERRKTKVLGIVVVLVAVLILCHPLMGL